MSERKRGVLTEDIEDKAAMLGFGEFNTTSLRLLPYIHYLVVNHLELDPRKVNAQERRIVSKWRNKDWLTGGASEAVQVTRSFYDKMNELIWMGYADE